jgi:hypothetical protein
MYNLIIYRFNLEINNLIILFVLLCANTLINKVDKKQIITTKPTLKNFL